MALASEPREAGGAALLAGMPGAALRVAEDGTVLAANAEAVALLDLSDDAHCVGELLGCGLPPPEAAVRVAIRRADRIPRIVELRAGAPDGAGTRVVLLREQEAAELLDESQRGLIAAFASAPIGMVFCDVDGRYVRVNPAFAALVGRAEAELIGLRDQELTHRDDRQADVDAAWRILDGKTDTWTVEKRFVLPSGALVWVIANMTFLRTEERLPLMWVGIFQDITGRKALEARLQREAEEDPLTGLPNRRRLDAELERVLARSAREQTEGAVLAIDLDGFKAVNDRFGHAAGDRALKAVAGALRQRLRATEMVARVGGDEFAILLPVATAEQARLVAGALVAAVASVEVDGAEPPALTAAVGVACFGPASQASGALVLEAADAAMYREKVGGPDRAAT